MAELYYRRYTELTSLIHMLAHRELTLLDPQSWDDKNDSYFLAQYKEKCGLKSVLALCFTKSKETYHHWRIFAPGPSGVCVSFRESAFHSAVRKVPGVTMKPVQYLTVKELKASTRIKKARLPFLKRYPFKPENEVRMLWQSETDERHTLSVPIELSAITRITLSPWLHSSLTSDIKRLLKSIAGCGGLKIYRSTLVGNAEWMKRGSAAI